MTMSIPRDKARDDHRWPALIGYVVIVLTFGVLGGWAATAPLGSAVIAQGVLIAETNRKTVQHFEGGIVSKIHVREGDRVTSGQVLFRLDETQPKANVEILRNQLFGALGRDARLTAELAGLPEIEFPKELTDHADDANVRQAMDDQKKQFSERKGMLEAQISVLHARAEQLRQEIQGLEQTRAANQVQVGFINDELTGVRELYEKQLVAKSRWLTLERDRARLEGEIGRLVSDRAKAEKAIGESQLQIAQIKQQFQEQVSKDLGEIREKIPDFRSKLVVARDVLQRLDVVAPATGKVQGLRIFTLGAVIKPGEPLLDIAPDKDKLIVQAQISTIDIESVTVGKTAEVRFPAFQNRTLPMIPGTLVSISRDRLIDDATKNPYYLGLVDVREEDIPEEYQGKTMAGLGVEVIIPTAERSALEYLVHPLQARLRKTFREK
jgi:HlyD family type I secretion membrane fusion protein